MRRAFESPTGKRAVSANSANASQVFGEHINSRREEDDIPVAEPLAFEPECCSAGRDVVTIGVSHTLVPGFPVMKGETYVSSSTLPAGDRLVPNQRRFRTQQGGRGMATHGRHTTKRPLPASDRLEDTSGSQPEEHGTTDRNARADSFTETGEQRRLRFGRRQHGSMEGPSPCLRLEWPGNGRW